MTFTATVSSPATTPTGNVSFTSDNTALRDIALTGGVATLSTSTLPVGTHTITANYSGDANFLTSSTTLTQTVTPVAGLTDPDLGPLMTSLSNVITDSAGNEIIGLNPSCATTGSYQGLSDIDKLNLSAQRNDGCLQFVTTFTAPTSP